MGEYGREIVFRGRNDGVWGTEKSGYRRAGFRVVLGDDNEK